MGGWRDGWIDKWMAGRMDEWIVDGWMIKEQGLSYFGIV